MSHFFQTVSRDLGVHKLPGGRSSPVDHRAEDSNPQIKVQQHLHACVSFWLAPGASLGHYSVSLNHPSVIT